MLDPKRLRNELPVIAKALKIKQFDLNENEFNRLEEARKSLQVKVEALQNQRNVQSKAIGQAKAQGQDIEPLKAEVKALGESLSEAETQLREVNDELHDFLAGIPNIPDESVPPGHSDEDNKLIRDWGQIPTYDFEPQDHVALGEKLGLMDFPMGAELAGSRFVVLRGALVRMQRALTQFMLDVHTEEHGYDDVYVPYIVNSDSLFATGQLPKFEEDLFKLEGDENYYLIPTAEVTLTNFGRGRILQGDELPKRYTAHTPCFRSEAGSYGKDTRGMIRQHQFEKVELVWFTKPDQSYDALETLTNHAETILQRLELPYRVMQLCGGDLGFSAAKTYDLEVWFPAQDCYREISSCSNCTDFQARRMQARFRDHAADKPALLHTLNGSGLAVGRTLIAIMENYQLANGDIVIPEALRPYMRNQEIIKVNT